MENKEIIIKVLQESLDLCPRVIKTCKDKTIKDLGVDCDAILIRDGIKEVLRLLNKPNT